MNLVTVLVTSYNSEQSISKTLMSIYYQDYERIELVICDDKSTDLSIERIEAFLGKYHNRFESIVKLFLKENIGTTKNIRNGIEHSSGKFIKVLSQGDLFCDTSILRKLTNFSIDNDKDFVFGMQRAYSIDGEVVEYSYFAPDPSIFNKYGNKQYALEQMLLYAKYIPGALFFYRTSFIIQNKYLMPSCVRYCEDLVELLIYLDDANIGVFNDYIIYYEYGTGISSSSIGLNEKMKLDHNNFYHWLINNSNIKLSRKDKRLIKIRIKRINTSNNFEFLLWLLKYDIKYFILFVLNYFKKPFRKIKTLNKHANKPQINVLVKKILLDEFD